tara:strand:+ start:2919 stop:3200 length:282 start_codon:yes stop_codon:yes gene_type:complete
MIDYIIMENLGHFFSSLLNMLGFTSDTSESSLNKSESKESNSSSGSNEELNKDETQDTNKKEESEETFTFIDVFEKEKDDLYEKVHDIFITNF